MSRLLKHVCWSMLALVFCTKVCFASAPFGAFDFTFDNTITPIINMSGTFNSELTMIGAGQTETPISFGIDLTNAMNGSLSSTGVTLVEISNTDTNGDDFIPAAFTAHGRISGGAGHFTRVVLSIRMNGSGTVFGRDNVAFTITLRYNLIFDAESGTLDGTCRGSARFQDFGSAVIRSDVSIDVPSGDDGSWDVHLDILPLNHLGGSGQVTTPDGRVMPGDLHGTYSPGLGVAVVTLTGSVSNGNDARGMGLTLRLLTGEEGVTLDTARGRVLGQTVRF